MLSCIPKMKHIINYNDYNITVSINECQHEKKMLLKAGFFLSIYKYLTIHFNYLELFVVTSNPSLFCVEFQQGSNYNFLFKRISNLPNCSVICYPIKISGLIHIF